MCRILAIKSNTPVSIEKYLLKLAEISKSSKEFQGHGWGVSYQQNGNWITYRDINPIWESDFSHLGESELMIMHARSAFRDEKISIEYNMPYTDSNLAFAFNGELHGVRIRSNGDIGAQKLFNYILRFRNRGMINALSTASDIISKKSEYIRAMNVVISDGSHLFVSSIFNEDPDYFTLHYNLSDDLQIVSSQPFDTIHSWSNLENGEVIEIS